MELFSQLELFSFLIRIKNEARFSSPEGGAGAVLEGMNFRWMLISRLFSVLQGRPCQEKIVYVSIFFSPRRTDRKRPVARISAGGIAGAGHPDCVICSQGC